MKKRILSILLALALLCAILPASALRASADASGTCGDNLTWTFDSATGTLTIEGSGRMDHYEFGEAPWYDLRESIKMITIGNSVMSIVNYAFCNCNALTSVTIGNSVLFIDDAAFSGCTTLTSVTIGDSVTSIGWYAFSDCTSLTSVTIPDSVTSIGNSAFSDCSSLTSVTIGDSVTSIGESAFSDCSSLTSVTIPNSVTSIGKDAFKSCTTLTTIIVASGNSNYCSDSSGVLFNKNKTELIKCPCGFEGSYTVPSSVTSIVDSAFSDCSSLTSVTIGDSVTSIGEYAFSYCTSLTSVTIPNSVTSIGGRAFCWCTSLKNVTIPDSVMSIGWSAFSECTSLTSVTIGDSVTSIGYAAFEECTSLTSVMIPDSVTSIGGSAFYHCTSLTSVMIPESVESIGDDAFASCSYDLVIFGVAGSAAEAYANENDIPFIDLENYSTGGTFGDGLTWRYDPDTCTLYFEGTGELPFYEIINDCPWLGWKPFVQHAVFGSGITDLGEGTLYGCDKLESVTIPDTVVNIPNYVFENCSSLPSVTLPQSVEKIGCYAFMGCSSLTELIIPAAVYSIDFAAFADCPNLTLRVASGNQYFMTDESGVLYSLDQTSIVFCPYSVVGAFDLPASVARVEDYAFYHHPGLMSVTIPAGCSYIGYQAFTGCTSLTSVTVLSVDCEIGKNYYTDTSLGVPGTTTIYGVVDSTAETYAHNYGYAFVAISLCSYGIHNYELAGEQVHTDTEPGWKLWRCSACGDEYTEEIPAGHVWTCTGLTELWNGTMSCIYCDAAREGDTSVELTLDEEITVPMAEDVDSVWFRFTPETSGKYIFDLLTDADLFGEVYTEEGESFGQPGYAGGGGIFGFTVELEAGQTYYFRAEDFYGYCPETVTVKLTKYSVPTSGECGEDLFWSFDEATGVLTVTGTGEMENYYGMPMFEAPWIDWSEEITAVVLPDGLTHIGSCTFDRCENLQSVNIPGTVTSIGEYGFHTWGTLEDVYFSGNADAWNAIEYEGSGYDAAKEALCGARVHYNTASAEGHWTSVNTAPTCTEEGVDGETCACGYVKGTVTPALGHDFVDGVCTRCGKEQEATDIFTDLIPGSYYIEAVNWAVRNGITTGTTATTFAPKKICTRCEVVTFLWRAEGQPEPTTTENPFTDVKTTDWYYKAVLWAVENGITSGTGGTTFSPKRQCTRGEVVTFLWRAADEPEPTGAENPFTDVEGGSFYYKAMLWAVEEGITNGTTATTFAPKKTCTRGEIVTFLYRDLA